MVLDAAGLVLRYDGSLLLNLEELKRGIIKLNLAAIKKFVFNFNQIDFFKKYMSAVRFELTHLSIADLKTAALDHSAKLTYKCRQKSLI